MARGRPVTSAPIGAYAPLPKVLEMLGFCNVGRYDQLADIERGPGIDLKYHDVVEVGDAFQRLPDKCVE